MYVIYMLRCSDNSLYTGITNDFEKRYKMHLQKEPNAAKYTKSRRVIGVEALWETKTKSDALKLEYRIKHIPKDKKEQLISNPDMLFEFFDIAEDVYIYKDVKGVASI